MINRAMSFLCWLVAYSAPWPPCQQTPNQAAHHLVLMFTRFAYLYSYQLLILHQADQVTDTSLETHPPIFLFGKPPHKI